MSGEHGRFSHTFYGIPIERRSFESTHALVTGTAGTLIVVACHLALAAQFAQRFADFDLPQQFFSQFQFLLVTSVGISVLIYRFHASPLIPVLVAMQLLLLAVATAPLGGRLEIAYVLYSALVAQSLHAAGMRSAIAVTVLVMIVPLGIHGEFTAWDQTIEGASVAMRSWLLLTQIIVGFFVVYMYRLLKDLHERTESLERIASRNRELLTANMNLQEYAIRAQSQSASEERKRVTRDIHDTVCYAFTSFIMLLNEATIAAKAGERERVVTLHNKAIALARESLSNTRISLRLFRQLERFREPLANRIKKLTDAFSEATGISISLQFGSLDASLAPDVEAAIQAMIQEGLANSVRHGHAQHVSLTCVTDEGGLTVTLIDDGEGAAFVKDGIGLSGMRERIASCGGTLHAEPVGNGFRLMGRFPQPFDSERTE